MFTGLVEDLGKVTRTRPRGNGVELTIQTALPIQELAIGDSIAVNGVCLTAERFEDASFIVTAGLETMKKTSLAAVSVGSGVHLERALRVGDRLGGHFVQGHVDGVGEVVSIEEQRESWVIWISVPDHLARYIASKGSICIDGVSLTVNEVQGTRCRVNIVPHTIEVTNMGRLVAGGLVNIEVDILAKYVERMVVGTSTNGALSLEDLKKSGFIK
jgi:riboflavin synthase